MTRSKIVPLNFGAIGKQAPQAFSCEVLRSKRRTLAIYITHKKVVVRCPLRASKREITEFIDCNQEWIETRLVEESLWEKESLRIEKGAKIYYRAQEASQ